MHNPSVLIDFDPILRSVGCRIHLIGELCTEEYDLVIDAISLVTYRDRTDEALGYYLDYLEHISTRHQREACFFEVFADTLIDYVMAVRNLFDRLGLYDNGVCYYTVDQMPSTNLVVLAHGNEDPAVGYADMLSSLALPS